LTFGRIAAAHEIFDPIRRVASMCTLCNYNGRTQVCPQTAFIAIGSAVYAGLIGVPKTHRHTQTTARATSVDIGRIHATDFDSFGRNEMPTEKVLVAPLTSRTNIGVAKEVGA